MSDRYNDPIAINVQKLQRQSILDNSFQLGELILDCGYPYDYDFGSQGIVENYKSYIFLEIDNIFDFRVFDDVISPFFKSLDFVYNFTGINVKTKERLLQKFSENGRSKFSKDGRSVIRYHNKHIV